MGFRKWLSSSLVMGRFAGRGERKSILARVKGKIVRSGDGATEDAGTAPSMCETQPCPASVPTPIDIATEANIDDGDVRYGHKDEATEDGDDWDLALNPYPSNESMKLPMDLKAPILNELMSETSIEVLMRCHSPSTGDESGKEMITLKVEDIPSVTPEEKAAAIAKRPLPCTRTSTKVSIDSVAHLDKYESIEAVPSTVLLQDDWEVNTDTRHSATEGEGKHDEDTSGVISEKRQQNRMLHSDMGDDELTQFTTLSSIFSEHTVETSDEHTIETSDEHTIETSDLTGSKPFECASDAKERLNDVALTSPCLDETKCPIFTSCLDKMMPSICEEDEEDDLTAPSSFSGSDSNGNIPKVTRSGFQRQSTPLVANRRQRR